MTEAVYWIWMQLLFGIASRRVPQFLEYFAHPRELYDNVAAGSQAAAMLTERELAGSAACMQRAGEIESRARRNGCDILTPDHPAYPALLRPLHDRPAVLYSKGDLACLQNTLAIAMVGTRSHTPYGRDAAALLAGGLAQGGAVVVSGLAHGIDTESHRAALAAGGKTVGVLGCGLDVDYPKGSGPLKTAMSRSGAVITEFPFGTPPAAANFPQRNRIISGMSHGTVVVEADLRSGSLITARLAREQGRDVFAVPGSIFEQGGQGVGVLLKEGAHTVTDAGDILALYPWHTQRPVGAQGVPVDPVGPPAHNPRPVRRAPRQAPPAPPPLPETTTETARQVFTVFGAEPLTVDDIGASTSLPAADILTALTELEISGLIQSYPGRRFGLSIETRSP